MTPKILTEFQIGNVPLKNRVFLPGHTTNYGVRNLPTDRNATYLASRAKGGVGLIFTEAIRVHPTSAGRSLTLGAFDDSCISAYAELTQAVHDHQVPIFAQIMHAGRQANGDATHTAAWSASALPWTLGGQVPHVMSQTDIKFMVKAFGDAAVRMQRANFDGLEIHLGHGHLIQQFLSPASNTRTDAYGGSLTNRLRFAVEVMAEVRNRVPDLVFGIRISANEFLQGGLDPTQMLEVVANLNDQFNLGFIHTSHSAYHGSWSLPSQFADMNFGHAPYRDHAGIFKSAFPKLPVLAVCRLDTLSEAALLIENDEADLVGLARPHIADPNLVAKYQAGLEHTNTNCIACNQECIGRVEKNLPISCVVNPEVGAEAVWQQIRTKQFPVKKVLVIGGGPAGMKAALAANQAGNQVTLIEATAQLGGQVNYIIAMRKRNRFELLIANLVHDLEKSEVEIKLNQQVTNLSEIEAEFDKIIIATGALNMARSFGEGSRVLTPQQAISRYAGTVATGESLVIYDEEGTWIAGSVAEELANCGYQIHFVTPLASLFSQITIYSKLALIPRLVEQGVKIYLSSKISADQDTTTILNSLNGIATEITNYDAIIDCGPRIANDELFQNLNSNLDLRYQVIGDALSPRTAAEAIYEGNAVGHFLELDLALAALDQN